MMLSDEVRNSCTDGILERSLELELVTIVKREKKTCDKNKMFKRKGKFLVLGV